MAILDIHREGGTHQRPKGVLQEYGIPTSDGDRKRFKLDWGKLDPLLDILHDGHATSSTLKTLGTLLRTSLHQGLWQTIDQEIHDAAQRDSQYRLVIRSTAAEIYQLPWELLTRDPGDQHIGTLPHVLVSYAWPKVRGTHRAKRNPRVLMAWSASGGEVPAHEHVAALSKASKEFDSQADVVDQASAGTLLDRLKTRPLPTALHLLCHGVEQVEDIDKQIVLLLTSPDGPEPVDSAWAQRALGRYAGQLGLVILSACHGASSPATNSALDSWAQALHGAGVAHVVASRYPLGHKSSIALTRVFYDRWLGQSRTVEEAYRAARDKLAELPDNVDWASLQLYSASDAGRLWPIRKIVSAFAALALALAASIMVATYWPDPSVELWEDFTDPGGLVLVREHNAGPKVIAAWDDLYNKARSAGNAQVKQHTIPSWTSQQTQQAIQEHAFAANTSLVVVIRKGPDFQLMKFDDQTPNGELLTPWLAVPTDPDTRRALASQLLVALARTLASSRAAKYADLEIIQPSPGESELTMLTIWLRRKLGSPRTPEELDTVARYVKHCQATALQKAGPDKRNAVASWNCAMAHYFHYGIDCLRIGYQSDGCPESRNEARAWLVAVIQNAPHETVAVAALLTLLRHDAQSKNQDDRQQAAEYLRQLDAKLPELDPEHPDPHSDDPEQASRRCDRLILMQIANELSAQSNTVDPTIARLACPVGPPDEPCTAAAMNKLFQPNRCNSNEIALAMWSRAELFRKKQEWSRSAEQYDETARMYLRGSRNQLAVLLGWAETTLHEQPASQDPLRRKIRKRLHKDRFHTSGAEPALLAHAAFVAWLAASEPDNPRDIFLHFLCDSYDKRNDRQPVMQPDKDLETLIQVDPLTRDRATRLYRHLTDPEWANRQSAMRSEFCAAHGGQD